MQSCLKRRDLLEKLEDITKHLQENNDLNSYCGKGEEFVQEFEAIRKDIRSKYLGWFMAGLNLLVKGRG